MVKNIKFHFGTQIIYVRHINTLFSFSQKGIEQTRVVETGINVTMTWGTKLLCFPLSRIHLLLQAVRILY